MRVRLFAACLTVVCLFGCIEMQLLLGPRSPDTTPAFNFNANGNNNAGTEEVDNENENGNADTNGNEEEDPITAINRGQVGDIPPISEDAEETVTESGLRMFDLVAGSGEFPQADSLVTVTYTGWLAEDGTGFDNGEAVQLSLPGLIEGWQEGLLTMQVGGSRRLIIPPELGYGEHGSPPVIPPDATLVFDLELLDFQ